MPYYTLDQYDGLWSFDDEEKYAEEEKQNCHVMR